MSFRDAFVLVGPTASGKTDVGQLLAERMGAAILSADSMQVYVGMDIGTAKQPLEERGSIPYLGIDLVTPDSKFNLWQYLNMVREQVNALPQETPLLVVGGSGLYVRVLMEGLDSPAQGSTDRAHWNRVFAEKGVPGLQAILQQYDKGALDLLADPQNPRRLIRAIEKVIAGEQERTWSPPARYTIVGIMPERDLSRTRIASRVDAMYDAGIMEEAHALKQKYDNLSDTALQAIGYCESFAVMSGHLAIDEAKERTVIRTNRLAKRQRTWFRHQADVDWVCPDEQDTIEDIGERVAARWKKYGSTRLKL
jgi:tRNA dimethylallyltransferase